MLGVRPVNVADEDVVELGVIKVPLRLYVRLVVVNTDCQFTVIVVLVIVPDVIIGTLSICDIEFAKAIR